MSNNQTSCDNKHFYYNKNVPSFGLEVKTLTIPAKGTAKILAQKGKYKLACYAAENILYISDDNGLTWVRSIAFAFVANISMAYVFNDGSVLIGTDTNLLYSSQDLLISLNAITCKDTDGSDLAFHVPVNALFAGTYFDILQAESGIVNGVEVLLFGCYHKRYKGATPINLYYTADNGVTVKVAYKFGVGVYGYDNGTATGGNVGSGGNPLGDALNPNICFHVHNCIYNEDDKLFYVQLGDGHSPIENGYLTGSYNIGLDSWNFIHYALGNSDNLHLYLFRCVGLRFYNNDKNVIWVSDGKYGGILKCSKSDLFDNDVSKHFYSFNASLGLTESQLNNGNGDCVCISKYGKCMIVTRYLSTLTLICTNDYGETWFEIPIKFIPVLTGHIIIIIYETDIDGYVLMCVGATFTMRANTSYLIKLIDYIP